MRTIVLLISIILYSLYQLNGQGFMVTYQETTATAPSNPNLTQIEDPQIRSMVESSVMVALRANMERTSQLLINNFTSLYTVGGYGSQRISAPEVEFENKILSGNIDINRRGILTVYKNRHNKLMLAQANKGTDGKEFLIEDLLTEYKWKTSKKTKEILGYTCIEATTKTESGANVTAWYAPDIPISDGPSSYWGLPGLILYLDVNDGTRIFTCTSIEQVNDMPAIEVPDKGERISRAQYDKLNEELSQNQSVTISRYEYMY